MSYAQFAVITFCLSGVGALCWLLRRDRYAFHRITPLSMALTFIAMIGMTGANFAWDRGASFQEDADRAAFEKVFAAQEQRYDVLLSTLVKVDISDEARTQIMGTLTLEGSPQLAPVGPEPVPVWLWATMVSMFLVEAALLIVSPWVRTRDSSD